VKKFKPSFLLIPAFFAVCGAVAFAEVVPGVDEPFNPGAYYSPTEISWEDSPSTFALRDLAGAGGSVYDYTRHIKSILFEGKFESILEVDKAKTANDEINSKPFDSSVFAETRQELEKVRQGTEKISTKIDIGESNATLRQDIPDDWEGYENTAYDKSAKQIWLDQTYRNVAEKAKLSLDEMETSINAANTILAHTNQAEGEMQLLQAQNELKALLAYELARRNALDANMANMQAAFHADNYDESIEAAYKLYMTDMQVSDPYDEKTEKWLKDKYGYTRPEPRGMPDFE